MWEVFRHHVLSDDISIIESQHSSNCWSTCSSYTEFLASHLQAFICRAMAKVSIWIRLQSSNFVVSSTTSKMIGLTSCIFRIFLLTIIQHVLLSNTPFLTNTGTHPRWAMLEHPKSSWNLATEHHLIQLQDFQVELSHHFHYAQAAPTLAIMLLKII